MHWRWLSMFLFCLWNIQHLRSDCTLFLFYFTSSGSGSSQVIHRDPDSKLSVYYCADCVLCAWELHAQWERVLGSFASSGLMFNKKQTTDFQNGLNAQHIIKKHNIIRVVSVISHCWLSGLKKKKDKNQLHSLLTVKSTLTCWNWMSCWNVCWSSFQVKLGSFWISLNVSSLLCRPACLLLYVYAWLPWRQLDRQALWVGF